MSAHPPANPDVQLRTIADLDALLSDPSPVLIFKHSTRCPISSHAHEEFVAWLAQKEPEPRTALVRVVEERPVSQEIARRLGVAHQSPQALLVAGGASTWDASHERITRDALAAAVALQR